MSIGGDLESSVTDTGNLQTEQDVSSAASYVI